MPGTMSSAGAEACHAVHDIYDSVGLPPPEVVIVSNELFDTVAAECEYVEARSWIGQRPPLDQGWRHDSDTPHLVLALVSIASGIALFPEVDFPLAFSGLSLATTVLGLTRRAGADQLWLWFGTTCLMATLGVGIRVLVDLVGYDPPFMPMHVMVGCLVLLVAACLAIDMVSGASRAVRHAMTRRRTMPWFSALGPARARAILPSTRLSLSMSSLVSEVSGNRNAPGLASGPRLESISGHDLKRIAAVVSREGKASAPLLAVKVARLCEACIEVRLMTGIALLRLRPPDRTATHDDIPSHLVDMEASGRP